MAAYLHSSPGRDGTGTSAFIVYEMPRVVSAVRAPAKSCTAESKTLEATRTAELLRDWLRIGIRKWAIIIWLNFFAKTSISSRSIDLWMPSRFWRRLCAYGKLLQVKVDRRQGRGIRDMPDISIPAFPEICGSTWCAHRHFVDSGRTAGKRSSLFPDYNTLYPTHRSTAMR